MLVAITPSLIWASTTERWLIASSSRPPRSRRAGSSRRNDEREGDPVSGTSFTFPAAMITV
jgi:hypothetical protein